MSTSRTALVHSLLLTLVTACGADDTTAADDHPGESASEPGSGDETATETDEQPIELVEARGISITKVEANQGVAVDLAVGGEWADGYARNAPLLDGRNTFLRVHFAIDESTWVARDIWGRMTVQPPGVDAVVSETKLLVVKNPDPRYRDETINFGILAEHAQVGTTFRIELFEEAPGVDDLPTGITVTPSTGPELVGFESERAEMKITLVPIDYRGMPEPTLPDLSPENLQIIEDALYQQNPLHELTITVHEPYLYEDLLTNLGSLLGHMSALRSTDGAAPNEYYHALVEVGTPAVNHVAGIANLPGDDKGAASSRVAATVWFAPGGSAETLVHEVGHNQGLNHVYCPNQATEAAGPDPNYPNDTGKITVYGFGIRNYLVYSTNGSHDYMTYCANSWVSDWTWNKTLTRIKTLTSWDYEAGSEAGEAPGVILLGAIYDDRPSEWWTVDGDLDGHVASGDRVLHLSVDGVASAVPAVIGEVDHGGMYWVMAELPRDFERVDAIVHEHLGGHEVVDPEKLVLAHRASRVTRSR